ncbi:MAG: hypothetical protein KC501_22140 [Myxococcales bacterium]|nr:hypothetical protein [Myxococcales bacterium]
MTIMTIAPWRAGSLTAVLGSILLLTPACGDDGNGEETAGDGSSGTGGSTGEATTSEPPDTTTGEDATGEGSTGPGPGSESSGTADGGSDSSGGSETGSTGACAEAMDTMTCEGTEGCVWLGSPMNGSCWADDPSVCPEIDMQQQCQQHPACEWNNQDDVCEVPA